MITGSMAGFGWLALTGVAATLMFGGLTQAGDEPRRTISVVGQGEVSVTPDLAHVSLAVETTSPTAARATADNAAKSAAVIQAVKRKLGERDKVETTGYSLQPRYGARKPGSDAPPQIVGYIARNEVQVTTRHLDQVGGILDAALDAGANRASNLSFGVDNPQPAMRQALAAAGGEARAQAESIATALGVKLGPVLTASTGGSPSPVPPMKMATMRLEAAVATPIEAGDQTVRATIHVTYAIADDD